MMQKTETTYLIKKARRRDADAFTELMQLYLKDMYKVALAILMNDEDVSDAIQDTILICWEKLDTLRQPQYFKTWMTRILINNCYAIRKKSLKNTSLEEYEEPVCEDHYNLELKEALSTLDEKYRAVITLFYGEGYRIDEISSILNIPPSTVKTRLSRGRKKLALYYRDSGKEYGS